LKPKLDENEAQLFREAMSDVKPLRQDPNAPTPRRRPVRARFARASRFASLHDSLHDATIDPFVGSREELSFKRAGVPDNVLRKLRRGEYRISGELDLHGLTVDQAKHALKAFLAAALARHAVCVRIIHGKGLRSGHQGPVLKSFVSGALKRTSAVMAYVSARPADGGTGALYVLLATSHS
jgi:DNA-nicking Smr family endonuclease